MPSTAINLCRTCFMLLPPAFDIYNHKKQQAFYLLNKGLLQKIVWFISCVLALFMLSACDLHPDHISHYEPSFQAQPITPTTRQTVRLGIHPLHNPSLLFERYGPIVEWLNQHIPEAHFVLEASRNYQEFESKLQRQQLDIAMPNPYQTLLALHQGYHVFGKMGDDQVFRGLVLVRKDSGIKHPTDLLGHAISFPSSTALAATMQPQYSLQEAGLAFGSYEARYVGSQESSIMNVVLGQTEAGATWPTPWIAFQQTNPAQAEQLQVLLETPPLVNNAWVALETLAPTLLERIAHELFRLHTDSQGQRLLAALPASHFEPANDKSYQPVRDFLEEFAHSVRLLDEPLP